MFAPILVFTKIGAPSGIRTHTFQGLNLVPLPIGLLALCYILACAKKPALIKSA